MDNANDRFDKPLIEGRLSVRAGVVSMILAWALTATLMAADRMPAHSTEAGILVGATTLFVAIHCCFGFVLRRRMAHLPVPLLRCAAMLSRIEAERGFSKLGTIGGRIWGSGIGMRKGAASPAHGSTSGRAIPLAIPTFPLVDGHPFLLGMGGAIGSNREQGGDGDCSLLLPIAPFCSLKRRIVAPFCSLLLPASGAALMSR
jgi:hypothetical protein